MIVMLHPTCDQSDQIIEHDIHVLPDTLCYDDMKSYFDEYGCRVDMIFDTTEINLNN